MTASLVSGDPAAAAGGGRPADAEERQTGLTLLAATL